VLGGLQQKLEEGKTFTGKVKDTLSKLRRRVKFSKAMKLAAMSAMFVPWLSRAADYG